MKALPFVVYLHQVAAFLPYSHALFKFHRPSAAHRWTPRRNFSRISWPRWRGGASEEEDVPIRKVLVLMDGFCDYHGGYLAARARTIPGVAVVSVLSDYVRGYVQQQGLDNEWSTLLPIPKTEQDAMAWKEACLSSLSDSMGGVDLTQVEWVAVYCESDSGLADAETLRELIQTTYRDTPTVLDARRHKHLQQRTVSDAGLAVAQYRLCSTVDETVSFAQALLEQGHSRVVVKPFRGVASEAVYLCSSMNEVQAAWTKITSTQVFGSSDQHANVLVQEFLDGTEYAVDTVSRNGQHKVAAIWRYVKQPANGASFCYFKTELVDASLLTDETMEQICAYVQASLTALGIEWGLTHTEVIVPHDNDARGPMLVEVNSRQHNMDFLPIVMSCVGYNVFDMMLLAMMGDETDWNAIPDRPVLQAHGCMVHLVNSAASGRLTHNCHLQDMVDLDSVMDCEVYEAFCTPGSFIQPTVDIRSDAGWAQLVHRDADALQRDYEQIVQWMPAMFATES